MEGLFGCCNYTQLVIRLERGLDSVTTKKEVKTMSDDPTPFGHSMNKDEELDAIRDTLPQVSAFLDKWQVYIGKRSEEAETAFIAITELERVLRARLTFLLSGNDFEEIPF